MTKTTLKDWTKKLEVTKSNTPSYDILDYTPIVVPLGMKTPETSHQTMARLMLSSGIISQDDYYKMLGVSWDVSSDDEATFEALEGDFDDEPDRFVQSILAKYSDDFETLQDAGRLASNEDSTKKNATGEAPSTKGIPVSEFDATGSSEKLSNDSNAGGSSQVENGSNA